MTTPLRLYNTLTRRVTPFVPRHHTVTVYVCGITPYDTTHLGHLFTYATADILIRYLEYKYGTVTYVQNLTDLDDPILQEARKHQESWRELGNRWTDRFIHDMKALNMRPPDRYPRATDLMSEMITIIQRLLEVGVAYASGGNVYFAVSAWPAYGQLSRLSREAMLSLVQEEGSEPHDPHKHDPLDFVLWRAQQPNEPAWDSPWGPGRPGWHIECSTMAGRLLGNTIDIHGGGSDLLFPHHESEIAQAECATGQHPFVRYWFHTAMVYYQGEKMSKSLGNLVLARELRDAHSSNGLRVYLARHHYRQPWEHHEQILERADRTAQVLRAAATVSGGPRTATALATDTWLPAFLACMDNDLQTPQAIEVLEQWAQAILQAHSERLSVDYAQQCLQEMSGILGLRLNDDGPEERVRHGWDAHLQHFSP